MRGSALAGVAAVRAGQWGLVGVPGDCRLGQTWVSGRAVRAIGATAVTRSSRSPAPLLRRPLSALPLPAALGSFLQVAQPQLCGGVFCGCLWTWRDLPRAGVPSPIPSPPSSDPRSEPTALHEALGQVIPGGGCPSRPRTDVLLCNAFDEKATWVPWAA